MPLEIAVAGAGPAGLAAALALARKGHKVVVFDQFDEPRPLGSGLILQPTGLAVLDRLGLGARLRALGCRLDRLYGRACGSGRIVLDVNYAALGDGSHGVAVHRAALFSVLYDSIKDEGIPVEPRCRIAGLDRASGGRPRLRTHGGRFFGPFDLIVDALGSRSELINEAAAPVVRRPLSYGAIWASLPWPGLPFEPNALEQRYDKASVMIGVLPIGRQSEGSEQLAAFFWSLKTHEHAKWQHAGLDPWKAQVRRLWPETHTLLDMIDRREQMVLAAYGHHTLPLPYGHRIVAIGDSAHSTSPQLGQGANMALIDVAALATALADERSLEQALPAYAKLRRLHVRLYQGLSRVFTPFYQSDSVILPFARDWLVAPGSRIPGVPKLLAKTVAGMIGDPFKRLDGFRR
jgi:2-polyprenyl-6-methoxyphenol hydroxylase-like FAD-dependent oxidoreductase